MIASLPMYDRPETAGATDRLWAAIRDRMRAAGLTAPETLTRGEADLWRHWTSPDLVLSQTCGYPFRSRLHGTVTLIGTPDFGIDGCAPGFYRSVFVARRSDPRETLAQFEGAPFAWNEDLSQSGWAAPRTHFDRAGLRLEPALRSGGHRLSALAVAEGRADFAALDAVTWQLLERWDPVAPHLRVIDRTDPTPGLPYISAPGRDGAIAFALIAEAIRTLTEEDRQTLGLRGIVRIPAEAYLAVPTPDAPVISPVA
jgi:ABC-type phosphate/phosphonate transport system substrate-binding protein